MTSSGSGRSLSENRRAHPAVPRERKAGSSAGAPTTNIDVVCNLLNGLYYSCAVEKGEISPYSTIGDISKITTPPILFSQAAPQQVRIDPQCEATLERHRARLLSGNTSQALLWLMFPDGGRCCIRDTAEPKFDANGHLWQIVGFVQEVTTASVAPPIVTAGDPWRKALQSIDLGVALWDTQDRLLLCNRTFLNLYEFVAPHLTPGLRYAEFLRIIGNTREFAIDGSLDDWVERSLRSYQNNEMTEQLLADGRCFEITAKSAQEDGVVTTVQDVTILKRGERALRKAKELAEVASTAKSRFLSAANHDLRQPLSTLKILIYNSMTTDDEAQRKDLLHAMDISVSIMEDLLGALLQVGQLDSGRIVPRFTSFPVSRLIERLSIEFSHQFREKGLQLRAVVSHATIKSDSALLERVVSNFVANALRYTTSGKVLLGCRRAGSHLRIEVWDTGCGISEEHQKRIFDEFYQVANQGTRQKKGLGLGLNIAQRLSQLLEQKITVRSVVGRGSMFAIEVPLGDIWTSEIGVAEISEGIGGQFSGLKVLMVEDNEILREAQQQLLERWGVGVTAARNSTEAVELAQAMGYIPGLLLVDYRLPEGIPGTEVIGKIRAALGTAVPGIIMTADTDPAVINEIKSLGYPVLIKPVSPPQLRVLMHNMLYEPPDA